MFDFHCSSKQREHTSLHDCYFSFIQQMELSDPLVRFYPMRNRPYCCSFILAIPSALRIQKNGVEGFEMLECDRHVKSSPSITGVRVNLFSLEKET